MKRATRPLRRHLLFAFLWLVLRLGALLPLAWLRAVGTVLGWVAHTFAGHTRRLIHRHLEIAFPELSPADRRRLARASTRHLGHTLAEVAWLANATDEEVVAQCDITGLEHLEAAREAGRGAVLITGHCGNWEILNARLGLAGIPMVIAVRQVDDPRVDQVATDLRARFGAEVVKRGAAAGRRLAGALSHNKVIGLLIDQDIRDIPSAFVPFFDQPAWTPTGGATIALRSGAPTVPAFIHRRADGTHLVEVQPPLPVPIDGEPGERTRALTAASTAAIEAQIRRHPDQWVWMHRRWRTQATTD